MAQTEQQQTPPKLKIAADGQPDRTSVADVVEFFINFDERVNRVRHPYADQVFEWKQKDDAGKGVNTFPFENAEARFAIGVIQAVAENRSEPELKDWITNVLEALGGAREAKAELTQAYDLDSEPEAFAVEKAAKLPANNEKRLYLSACWLELLCTAEARVLGWIYQDLYDKPYEP